MARQPMNRVEGDFGLPQAPTLPPAERLGYLLGALIVVVGTSWLATGWAAEQLAHDTRLCEPLFELAGRPIYAPFAWFTWNLALYRMTPASPHQGAIQAVGTLATLLPLAAAGGLAGARLRRLRNRIHVVHGSAQWARHDDVQASELLGPSGAFVGTWIDPKRRTLRYLRHNGPEHVMVFAPTRSGKGVGLVLPTLLSWRHSALVLDPKGENWALTAGWRASLGHNTLRYDPASHDTVRYNPLAEIRIHTDHETGDVQAVATALVDPDGKQMEGANAHWASTARSLLTGAITHCIHRAHLRGTTASLSDVVYELSDPDRPIKDVLRSWLTFEHDPTYTKWLTPHGEPSGTHPVVAATAQEQLNRDSKEAASVLSTALTPLTLYRDPLLAANTAVSDFTIDGLMNSENPTALYLVLRPSEHDRLKPLIRLILDQIVRRLTSHMEFADGASKKSYRHRLLLLLDEFPSLGHLRPVEAALPYMAGYGLKAYLITQDSAQLRAVYGRDETVLSNCHIRVAYAPNNYETAKMLSDMTGTTTLIKTARSSNTSGGTNTSTSKSVSDQEIGRPLLTPDECMRLPAPLKDATGRIQKPGDILVFPAGRPPIYGKQMLFWEDPQLLERSKMPPPEPRSFRTAEERRPVRRPPRLEHEASPIPSPTAELVAFPRPSTPAMLDLPEPPSAPPSPALDLDALDALADELGIDS